MRKTHRWNLAYAAGNLYVRCDCGWEGTRHSLTSALALSSPGDKAALRAVERKGREHAQDTAREGR
jgi:hypothetical protein